VPERAKSLTELSRRLDVSASYLSRKLKERGAPKKGGLGYDVDAIRQHLEDTRQRRPKDSPKPAKKPAKKPASRPRTPLDADAPGIDPDATPVEVARAALRIAAHSLGQAAERGEVRAKDLDGMKKTLDGLRMAEKDYLKLQQDKGNIVTRDQAAEVAAWVAERGVEALRSMTARLVSQVSMWFADPAFVSADQGERQRLVEEWAEKRERQVREVAARKFESLLGEVA